MNIQYIVNQFNANCENFANQQNALSAEKRTERNTFIQAINLSMIKLEFVFATRQSVYNPPCTLYCRIYLNKNSQAYFLLPDLFSYANIEEYRCVFFTYIESPERLDDCFLSLTEILQEHLPDFERLILHQKSDEIYQKQFEHLCKRLSLSPNDIDYNNIDTKNSFENKYYSSLQSLNENYTVMLFTNNDAYYAFLTKDIANAERLYAKRMQKDGVHPFEKMIYDFIASDEYSDYTPITENCFMQKLVNCELKGKRNFKKNLRNFSIIFIFLALIFFALTVIIKEIMFKTAIYGAGMTIVYAIITALIASLLPAIVLSCVFCGLFDKFFSKIDYKRLKNLRSIIVQKKDKISNNIAIFLSLALGIAVVVVMSTTNIRFYENKMVVCDIKISEYYYKDIDYVYYIESRRNDYGNKINRASYVITFKNGETIDLDGWTSVEDTEKYILPILEKVPIRIESDKDLP